MDGETKVFPVGTDSIELARLEDLKGEDAIELAEEIATKSIFYDRVGDLLLYRGERND